LRTRKLGIKKFMQMPPSFRAKRSQDEWISDAISILYQETEKYKPREGCCYNDYMIHLILPNRLTDIQREMFRKNPPVDKELRRIVAAMKHELKRIPEAEEIADRAGVSIERAQKFLDEGVGVRLFERQGEMKNPDEWGEIEDYAPGMSPLKICLRKEFRRIVLDCIRKLNRRERYVIVRHFFFGISIADIARGLAEEYEAVRTRFRRARESVMECVKNRYDIHVPGQGGANG
jgi:RNA polymerase sigma factor (sigma-70 family)